MDEALMQILSELKEIRGNQAVAERESVKFRSEIAQFAITQHDLDRNQAVLEQGISRINDRLDTMQGDIDKRFDTMQGDITEMRGDIEGMQGDIEGIHGDIETLKQDVRRIEVTLENEIQPGIQLLQEGNAEITGKLRKSDNLTRRVEDLEDDVGALKLAVGK